VMFLSFPDFESGVIGAYFLIFLASRFTQLGPSKILVEKVLPFPFLSPTVDERNRAFPDLLISLFPVSLLDFSEEAPRILGIALSRSFCHFFLSI